jgi:signal transduction histidine kinase
MPDCQPFSLASKWLNCPDSSFLFPFLGWLTLTGMVAHFAPEWWLSMVRIIHISIVVRNLIANAIKFCKKNDTISVMATHQDKFIMVSVKDSGVGMTPEQINKLFKGKVDSKLGTEKEFGTGIGLLFCKDLVEKAHGKIGVESEIGTGSVFSFTILAVS